MFTKLWAVKMSDWERSLVVAILTSPFTIVYDSLSVGSLTFDWKKVVAAALAGGVGYILKNLLTGEGGKLLTNKTEPPKP